MLLLELLLCSVHLHKSSRHFFSFLLEVICFQFVCRAVRCTPRVCKKKNWRPFALCSRWTCSLIIHTRAYKKGEKKSSKKPNTLMPSSVPKCDTESGSAATTWAQEVQLDVHSRASAKRGKKIETLLACTGKP